MLRNWQSECLDAALNKFTSGQPHFLCLATPGAGKTVMAAEIASSLKKQGIIDLVLCFSPSLAVAESIKSTFSWRLNCTFNGGVGSIGGSYTYQNMLYMNDEFWDLLKRYRVLVVFDEIHHCSGNSVIEANAWGMEILTKIQDYAAFTLALTGTPWRSDAQPISLARYSKPEDEIQCDYIYGLSQAVKDHVCRSPKIVLVDNDDLSITSSNEEAKCFNSIQELLMNESIPYSAIITNREAMLYLLGLSCHKLAEIRQVNPRAGGLVVASSVEHANDLLLLLQNEFNQSGVIVTYRHDDPLNEITRFRTSDTQWIVSVGMVSEGTDIPRLQVCCHLSHIKTELYFRQVLGRILRISDAENQEAWLYTIAESQLSCFAERIAEDLPDNNTVIRLDRSTEQVFDIDNICGSSAGKLNSTSAADRLGVNIDWGLGINQSKFNTQDFVLTLGTFKQRLLSVFLD
ncbi:DEAD/DEAH box helicase family protein [Moritella sp.]|uniref:DEAD/DEAH box helicase n=1 Tax=Moritella sp. TaxID=78556 RepID=UPI001DFB3349|nr:DEAD/DEAH box helicase family protein [Moritella sp.]MCJ8350887.1 DEAD/DEAH box helicase family protein [Moritella sp.]NQZ40427.1 DEAD/DEAH box helicase family protein [Moritella sp.]